MLAVLIGSAAPPAQAEDSPFSLKLVAAGNVLRTADSESSVLDVAISISDPDDDFANGVDDGDSSWLITATPTTGGEALDLGDFVNRTQDTDDVDVWTVAYFTDSDPAGDYTLTVSARLAGDSSTFTSTMSTTFGIRNATRSRLDVSPEPAAKGTTITAAGSVERIDFINFAPTWVPAEGVPVSISFRPTASKTWTVMKELETDGQGEVSEAFEQGSAGGTWRLDLARTSALAASSASDVVATGSPGACAGHATCKIVKRIDVDGDGRADEIGVIQRGETSIDLRVKTARTMLTLHSSIGDWYGSAFWGAAAIDGVKGAEIVLGRQVGAHLATFRVVTVRKGALGLARTPGGSKDWYVDGSFSSNMGYTRKLSAGKVYLVQAGASRHTSGTGHTGSRTTYRWTGTGWKFSKRASSKHLSDKAAYAMGGWHVKGLRVFM